MTGYVALLRGVNLGKRQLKMADLKHIAVQLGLDNPRTFIASGNLLFSSAEPESVLRMALEAALRDHMGASVDVMVRTAAEMAAVARANPFAGEPGNQVAAIFLAQAPDAEALVEAKNVGDERMALGTREIYVHYPGGMGQSRLRIGAAAKGTARNMNTVARLAELAEEH
ncbi:MAG: DUF1697 domain-containing protein [Sphingomicrobium sp.]